MLKRKTWGTWPWREAGGPIQSSRQMLILVPNNTWPLLQVSSEAKR